MTELMDIIKGEALWVFYLLTLLSVFIPSNKWRILVVTMIPILTAVLARTGRFWINQNIILFSSLLILVTVMVSYMTSQGVRDIVDTPENSKAKTGAFYSFLFLLFFASIFGLSKVMTMYGEDVVSNASESWVE